MVLWTGLRQACWDELDDPRSGNAGLRDCNKLLIIAFCSVLCGFSVKRGVPREGRCKLELQLLAVMAENESPLSPRTRQLIEDMRAQWAELDRRIETVEDESATCAKQDGAGRTLRTDAGSGPSITRNGPKVGTSADHRHDPRELIPDIWPLRHSASMPATS